MLPYPLRRLGQLARCVAISPLAVRLCLESLAHNRDVGEQQGVAASLVGLALVAAARGQPRTAAHLLGKADALLTAFGAGSAAIRRAGAPVGSRARARSIGAGNVGGSAARRVVDYPWMMPCTTWTRSPRSQSSVAGLTARQIENLAADRHGPHQSRDCRKPVAQSGDRRASPGERLRAARRTRSSRRHPVRGTLWPARLRPLSARVHVRPHRRATHIGGCMVTRITNMACASTVLVNGGTVCG